jgi:malonyl-CoA/methylmalonyl-CoA synthetase
MDSLVIKFGGYKILSFDIEKEILGLDYVTEVMVVGVDSEETGQSVAAAVVLAGVSFYSI